MRKTRAEQIKTQAVLPESISDVDGVVAGSMFGWDVIDVLIAFAKRAVVCWGNVVCAKEMDAYFIFIAHAKCVIVYIYTYVIKMRQWIR